MLDYALERWLKSAKTRILYTVIINYTASHLELYWLIRYWIVGKHASRPPRLLDYRFSALPRGGGTGTASTAIAVPKLKQVGLSRTKTGVEIYSSEVNTITERCINYQWLWSSIDRSPARQVRRYFLGTPNSICARAVASGINYIGARFSIIRGRGQFYCARASRAFLTVKSSRTNSLILPPPLLPPPSPHSKTSSYATALDLLWLFIARFYSAIYGSTILLSNLARC